jgi:hypothetical protein
MTEALWFAIGAAVACAVLAVISMWINNRNTCRDCMTTEADSLAATIRGQSVRHVHHFPARVAGPYTCSDAEDAARMLIDHEAGSATTVYAVERVMREDPQAIIVLEPRLHWRGQEKLEPTP